MQQFEFLPHLMLRAPLYSFVDYDLEHLSWVLLDPLFQTAICLASHSLFEAARTKDFCWEKLSAREKHALAKYYNRMCFRPVPFGAFASFSLAQWADGGTVSLAAEEGSVLHLLTDQQDLRSSLEKTAVTDDTRVVLNPVLYKAGREYRLLNSTPDAQGRYQFSVDALPAAKFYDGLFAMFRTGGVTVQQLLDKICRTGVSREEASGHLQFLLDSQVVFSPRRGNVISFAVDAAGCSGSAGKTAARHHVGDVARKLVTGGHGPVYYAAVEKKVTGGGPGKLEQDALQAALSLLAGLVPVRSMQAMDDFKNAFRARFGDRAVPLLLALDPDIGIPYGVSTVGPGNDLLDDIRFPAQEAPGGLVEWQKVHQLLFNRWPHGEKDFVLRLDENDAADLPVPQTGILWPTSCPVLFRQAEDYLVIDHAGGVSAAAIVGRFSLFGDDAAAFCRDLAEKECLANPEVLFADIAQLSDDHMDNVNRRRALYPYELPLNVYPALPQDRQIWPMDLLLSLQQGELVLTSVRHRKRVVPRLATAYNYHRTGLPLFRFLCDLQYAGLRSDLNLRLDEHFPGLPAYPRVMCGQVILSLASWHLKEPEISALLSAGETDPLLKLRDFRLSRRLPKWVSLGTFDQQLVFDLTNPADCLFFLDCIRNQKEAQLREYLLPAKVIRCAGKPVAGQYIAFLSQQRQVYRPSAPPGKKIKTARDFRPGSEWLYVKLFCTPEMADTLLTAAICPLINAKGNNGVQWFFIRYHEGGHHLRIRFQLSPRQTGNWLSRLNGRLAARGFDQVVRDFQADTYSRELERYGYWMLQAEELFCLGSRLVCRYLTVQQKNAAVLDRFSFALLTADAMITAWIHSPEKRLEFTATAEAAFFAEFNGDKQLKIDVDRKYRVLASGILELLQGPASGILPRRLAGDLEEMRRKVAVVRDTATPAGYTPDLSLLSDLVHMQMNRTFRSGQRRREFLVYACLHRHWRSANAIAGKRGNTIS